MSRDPPSAAHTALVINHHPTFVHPPSQDLWSINQRRLFRQLQSFQPTDVADNVTHVDSHPSRHGRPVRRHRTSYLAITSIRSINRDAHLPIRGTPHPTHTIIAVRPRSTRG